MKYLITFLFLANVLFANAQGENLNNYKYVIVDNQYEFQGKANQFHLNEFIVYELKKRNFKAFRNSEELPADLNRGGCNALSLKIDQSGTFTRNLVFNLEDCSGILIFQSKEGIGRTKSDDKAYFEAVRDLMSSFDEINYKYVEPYYTATAPNSEPKAMGIDSVLTMSGQPGNYKDQKNNEKVVEETVPQFDNQVSDATSKAMQSQIAMIKKDYATSSRDYSLIKTDNGFNIFKGDTILGTLKKSTSGCYLAITTSFIGIGFETSNGITIEHTTDGKDQSLYFIKE